MGAQAEEATFAGGCFWCVEHAFDDVEGVISTTSGYTGGQAEDPSYEEVSSGNTGHAEAVRVVFDPQVVSYAELLEVFWKNIDPTTPNRQFCDVGSQYRSAIFYHSEEQRKAAEKSLQWVRDNYDITQIVTEITAVGPFYAAEDYHQDFHHKSPLRYKSYRYLCGRDRRLEELWESHEGE
jgi:peptide-methionine (S)-S-oxide reductase